LFKKNKLMLISNRRDAGYTIISRFEETFRNYLNNFLCNQYENFYHYIPQGIYDKAIERNMGSMFESPTEFFENIDFPDLKEITLYKNHWTILPKKEVEKEKFIKFMDELYLLRCKIAHIKGYFTSIDIDKLIDLTDQIAKIFSFDNFQILLKRIQTNPNEVIITTPAEFVEDFLEKNGVINNLPIPDYEYEGGFVGREEDRRKIIQYLKSDRTPVITLTGSGGVGKTSLALKVIQDITEQPENNIFDAIVWLSAKENKLSPLGIEDIEPTLKNYEELLDIVIGLFEFQEEIKEGTIEEKESLCEKIFELTNKALVVVDNLETITDDRIINFILDAPLNIKFLITSRKGIGQVERRHEIKELKLKEAIYLFRQLCKDKQLLSLSSLPDQVIKKYVERVSNYPLAIKWVIGQVARGKDINKIIEAIHTTESDISRFCYDQIFTMLSDNCKKVLFALSLIEESPTPNMLQYTVELNEVEFEDSVEELILMSLVIPEQFQNDRKEISTTYNLLPLTKGYTRLQLNKDIPLRQFLINRLNHVENMVTASERAKKEYRHSLYNFGAKSDEEKIAAIIAQTALARYQSGLYDEAVEEYKRAIKISPNFAPLYRNWGVMESMENHISEAIALMQKASELDSSDPQIYLLWGNIYRKSSKHSDADKKYQIAYNLAPNDPIILGAYGQTKSHLGFYEEASVLLNESMMTGKKMSSLKHMMIIRTSLAENNITWGESLVEIKDYEKAEVKYLNAIQICEEAIKENEQDQKVLGTLYKARFKLALLLLSKNQGGEAVLEFENVINANESSFKHAKYKLSSLIELAEYYIKKKNREKVKEYFDLINLRYKNTPVANIDYRSSHQRLKIINEYLDPTKQIEGVIRNINAERKFAILEDTNGVTFLAHQDNFVVRIVSLPHTYKGQRVLFSPSFIFKQGTKQGIADNVRLIEL
jgi:LuxR family glucitol operon transcriptional activator